MDHLRDKITERPELGHLATFVPNKREPIYSWFYYKEGFAKDLVFQLLDMFQIKPGQTVLDPFCGSGTTLLACKQKGIDSIGFDVLPVCIFAATAKTATYDNAALYADTKMILKTKYQPQHYHVPEFIKRAFNIHILDDIMLFRAAIRNLPSEQERNFFLLALVRTAMKVTYAFKDGGVLKIRKRPVPSFRQIFRRTMFGMMRDIQAAPTDATVRIVQGDARYTELPDASIDAVITSPPYLNNIDYTKVYALEEFFIQGDESPAMRSYLGVKPAETNDTGFDIPLGAVSYVQDLKSLLQELHRVTKQGAPVAVIIGNAYVEGAIVESDLILASIAESLGFHIDKIITMNTRFALEQRTQKKGVLRESLVLMKKQ